MLVLGSDYSNLSRILQIFADVFLCEVLSEDEETKQRVLRIIAQMQVCKFVFCFIILTIDINVCPSVDQQAIDKFNAYFSQLNEMQQDSIRQAITGRQ